MQTELKPCPFCGWSAEVVSGGPGNHFIQCQGCRATSDDLHMDTAIAAWNRRALTSATPPDVAGLLDAALRELDNVTAVTDQDSNCIGCAENLLRQAATALRLSAGGGASHAARDVLEERRRQVEVEDFDASHDDMATKGQLAGAAASYAMHDIEHWAGKEAARTIWPWDKAWWKPANRRRNLVKAGALILAEIERLDRLPASPTVEAGHVE